MMYGGENTFGELELRDVGEVLGELKFCR